ncbi:hypothetical protein SmJEL517_g03897 [Synchytrium microbalum]|uniref:Reverse transcriptase Ty1/copia-type domain-containing protein n=1 Tax=Synchytrium microbalum TaxID=1806994 RepID=A0A507C127_9FUNG|nr:uncharacterized protein SmJEL517_g03897 [Synchytrium microbalum]TPX33068.1 hypothetical protein SmJEL517_g03897 [Synchytrium microbalum]
MSQVKYVDDILGAFGMTDCNAQPTPLAPGYDTPQPDSPPCDKPKYQKAIGMLLYLARCTRPDLMTAVSILAKYSSNPTQYHWAGIIHILSYVKGTREYRLSLGGADLLVYSDADWAKDVKVIGSVGNVIHTTPEDTGQTNRNNLDTSQLHATPLLSTNSLRQQNDSRDADTNVSFEATHIDSSSSSSYGYQSPASSTVGSQPPESTVVGVRATRIKAQNANAYNKKKSE